MFNKLKSIKKKDDTITTYQVERLPDFFDNIERLTRSFDPLFKSAVGAQNEGLLIIIFEKCINFCIEAEKIKAKNYYEQNNVADWWNNVKKNNSLDKE